MDKLKGSRRKATNERTLFVMPPTLAAASTKCLDDGHFSKYVAFLMSEKSSFFKTLAAVVPETVSSSLLRGILQQ